MAQLGDLGLVPIADQIRIVRVANINENAAFGDNWHYEVEVLATLSQSDLILCNPPYKLRRVTTVHPISDSLKEMYYARVKMVSDPELQPYIINGKLV